MHTVFALLCFVVVIHWLIFPYPSGLLHWHCGNLTIAPVPAKQPWWIWINTSCEFIMNDCITTTKQSITKPCAYFLGYTVCYGQCWLGIVLWWLGRGMAIYWAWRWLINGNVTIFKTNLKNYGLYMKSMDFTLAYQYCKPAMKKGITRCHCSWIYCLIRMISFYSTRY